MPPVTVSWRSRSEAELARRRSAPRTGSTSRGRRGPSSSTSMPASSRARAPGEPDGGRRVQVGPVRTRTSGRGRPVPECGNTQRSRGTPSDSGRLDRAQDQAGALLDLLFEFMSFVYGIADHPVVGRGGGDLVGACRRCWIQAFGFLAATSLKRDHSGGERAAVLVGGATARGPQRDLEHRVDLHRHERRRGRSRRVTRAGSSLAEQQAVGRVPSGCVVQSSVVARGAGGGARAPRLAAREQHEVGPAGLDVGGGLVHDASGRSCRPSPCRACARGDAPSRSATSAPGSP